MRVSGVLDFLKNDRKTLYIVLSIIVILIFSLTMVYAALSVTLNITGNAEVVASSWDIYLDNVKVSSGSVNGNNPSISNNTATFTTTLNTPGDFYEFSIDVVNDGSIDAMIDSISKTPTLTESQAKYLKYEIEYQNGESISTKQAVLAGSFVRLKVRLEFRKDITVSDLPSKSETLTLSFTVNYIQNDGTEEYVEDNGVYYPYKFGNENCFGTECFYVISSNDDTATMISKMNITLTEKPVQSLDADTTSFSSASQKGTNYSDYSGSIAESYVNSYKVNLEENFGMHIIEARLISKTELLDSNTFACVENSNCSSAYPWIYSTSYWTNGAYNVLDVWYVDSSGLLKVKAGYMNGYGIRPVIVIPKV